MSFYSPQFCAQIHRSLLVVIVFTTLRRILYTYLLFLFFFLVSMVALATVKDGEHDKTHMVNKLTFNNTFPLKILPSFR